MIGLWACSSVTGMRVEKYLGPVVVFGPTYEAVLEDLERELVRREGTTDGLDFLVEVDCDPPDPRRAWLARATAVHLERW